MKDILPKEHGTWAMLLVPWAVGAGVAREVNVSTLVLLAVALLAFLAHAQVAAWLRPSRALARDAAARTRAGRLASALAGLALLTGAPLLVTHGARLVVVAVPAVVAGVASVVLVLRRVERALPGQVLAAVALPLTAAAAHAVARTRLEPLAWALWALCALFFLGGVFYVRMKIDALGRRARLGAPASRIAAAGPTLIVEGAIVVLAAIVVATSQLSPLVLLGFGPVAVQAVFGIARLDRPARLKRVGLLSLAHSIAFAALVIAFA